jgi:hypothetical protein
MCSFVLLLFSFVASFSYRAFLLYLYIYLYCHHSPSHCIIYSRRISLHLFLPLHPLSFFFQELHRYCILCFPIRCRPTQKTKRKKESFKTSAYPACPQYTTNVLQRFWIWFKYKSMFCRRKIDKGIGSYCPGSTAHLLDVHWISEHLISVHVPMDVI